MNAFVFTFFAFAVIVSLHACSPPPQPAGYPLSSDMTSEIKRLINDRYEEENRQKDPRQLGKRSAEAAIVSVLTDLVEIKNEQTSVVENKIQKSIFSNKPSILVLSTEHLLTNGNVELVFHIQTTYCVHLEDALRSKEIAEVKAIKIITIRCH